MRGIRLHAAGVLCIGLSFLSAPSASAQPTSITLQGTARDFLFRGTPQGIYNGFPGEGHPDFQNPAVAGVDDRGLVQQMLGADNKPVYFSDVPGDPNVLLTGSTHGKTFFDQWYRDTPGVNVSIPVDITFDLDQNTGNYVYDNQSFFPVDNQGFGNQGDPVNYSFTFELHTLFTFTSLTQTFTFTGDDDIFVFINKQLVIDLGGVHNPQTDSVTLDAITAAELGMSLGQVYSLDVFTAERARFRSTVRMETNIPFFSAVVTPEPATGALFTGGLLLMGALVRRRFR